jgi:hypothetical protein
VTSPARSSKPSTWVDDLVDKTRKTPRAEDQVINGFVRQYLPEERDGTTPPRDLREWLQTIFPQAFDTPFAPHQESLIEWAAQIRPETHPRPYIGIWPRGGGKSTLVESLCIALGAPRPVQSDSGDEEGVTLRAARDYCLYVSETQGQADDHVQEIANRLESEAIVNAYPQFARPRTRRYGDTKSWSRTRLITGTGFIVDALGLNAAGRGVKVEDERPDLMIFDEIDAKFDSRAITRKKESLIKDKIIPMFGENAAIVGVQNKVTADGVFAKLADDRADFLMRRKVVGPIPAIRDLETEKQYDEEAERYRDVIVDGTPTWAGQDLEACQRRIDESGLSSFLREGQHEVRDVEGALWTVDQLDAVRVSNYPSIRRLVIGVDPSGGDAETGIVVVGLCVDGNVYVLEDLSMPGDKPNEWGCEVADAYFRWQADAVIAEKNQGGEMVRSTIVSSHEYGADVPVYLVQAKRGKQVRADAAAGAYGSEETGYDDTRVCHVGTFPDLEAQMTSWVPGNESPDRLDALVYGVKKLIVTAAESNQSSTPPTVSY